MTPPPKFRNRDFRKRKNWVTKTTNRTKCMSWVFNFVIDDQDYLKKLAKNHHEKLNSLAYLAEAGVALADPAVEFGNSHSTDQGYIFSKKMIFFPVRPYFKNDQFFIKISPHFCLKIYK